MDYQFHLPLFPISIAAFKLQRHSVFWWLKLDSTK